MTPKPDAHSIATINAVKILLASIQELERARIEREERLALWPIEDVELTHEHAVVNGKMRDAMAMEPPLRAEVKKFYDQVLGGSQ